MSRMSDIHAAASEIDTTDADAVQKLADRLACERYAADIAAYADAVRGVIESLALIECEHDNGTYLSGYVAHCEECHAALICAECECRPGARCDHGCHA